MNLTVPDFLKINLLILSFLQVGFNSLYFARIDYQDREKRKDEKTLEVLRRGSRSLGSTSQVNNKTTKRLFVLLVDFLFHVLLNCNEAFGSLISLIIVLGCQLSFI